VSSVDALPFQSTPLRAVEHVARDLGSSRLVWAGGGRPVLLDVASGTMLDLFTSPLTPQELADDLEAALGIERDVAARAAFNTSYALRTSGLLVREDEEPRSGEQFFYPPLAST
jgi:hypothetical protein